MRTMFTLLLTLALVGCASAERSDLVTLRGEPVTLEGAGPDAGDKAPDFVAVGTDMKDVRLSDYRGKTVVVSVVPSLDTKVCSIQTRSFNEQVASAGRNVVVLTVSMDLPFAQKRYCAAEGIDHVVTVSDYKYRDFAKSWGLRIQQSGLLARSVFVVDPSGVVTWKQIVPELTHEPDYEAAMTAVKRASSGGA